MADMARMWFSQGISTLSPFGVSPSLITIAIAVALLLLRVQPHLRRLRPVGPSGSRAAGFLPPAIAAGGPRPGGRR